MHFLNYLNLACCLQLVSSFRVMINRIPKLMVPSIPRGMMRVPRMMVRSVNSAKRVGGPRAVHRMSNNDLEVGIMQTKDEFMPMVSQNGPVPRSDRNNDSAQFLTAIGPLLNKEDRYTPVAKVWERLLAESKNGSRWLTSGDVNMPSLCIDGQLQKYPFDAASCQSLIAMAAKAPFGRGNETVMDDKVRKAWQIDANRISFENPVVADELIRDLTSKVREGLSLPDIRLELYKMLIYEEGGHFSYHRDTLRGDHHVGSVIVTLPIAPEDKCTGGDFVVHNPNGQETTWNGQTQGSMASYGAFFTDCSHELKPLQSGYRVALAFEIHYNLTSSSGQEDRYPGDSITIPQDWADRVGAFVDEILKHQRDLYILCRHEYGAMKDPARQLKGVDLMLHEVLDQRIDKSKYTITVEGDIVSNDIYNFEYDLGPPEWKYWSLGNVGDFGRLLFYKNDPFVVDSVDGRLHCLIGNHDREALNLPPAPSRFFNRDSCFPFDIESRKTFFLWQDWYGREDEWGHAGNDPGPVSYQYRAHYFKVERIPSDEEEE